MINKINLSLTVPSTKSSDKYISFRLKQELYNEPSQFTAPSVILAVSDIEGNFLALRRLLMKCQVINKNYEWIFGKGHLVIVGDCFDRGEHVIECLWLIYSLEDSARKAGGYVHFILGNHEIMNMNSDWRYVHPKYAEHTRSKKPHTALYSGNAELWRWLCTKNVMEKIGDILFVHGGISKEIVDLKIPIDLINDRIRPYYTSANSIFSDALLSTVFNSDKSPFWYRGYYQTDMTEDLVDTTMVQFGISTIITGHTMMEDIITYFSDKVININTDHTTEKSAALLIVKSRFYKVSSNGDRKRIK